MPQKIIITGYSSGLGWALAQYFAKQTDVLGLSRRIVEAGPARLQQISVDLSCVEAVQNLCLNGQLTAFLAGAAEVVLINNAGMVQPNAVLGKQEVAQIATAVSLNIAAPLMLSNFVLGNCAADVRVKIMHISSGAGRKAYAGWSVYGATKAALDHHALCVAAEAHENVGIVSIAPGVLDTDMQAEIRGASAADFPILPRFQALKAQNGLSQPSEVAVKIAQVLARPDFGDDVILDVREL